MFPDQRQRLLLRAALLEGGPAREALAAWREQIAIEDLDVASYRLLPLLWRRRSRLDLPVPEAERLRGVFRKSWTRSQLLLHRATPAVTALRQRAIPLLVLKGAALSPRYYGDWGTRFMNDIDVLVPADRAHEAREVLASLGWRPGLDLPESYLETIHGLGYQDGRGGDLDLHWHALWECCGGDDDRDLWADARPMDLCGHQVQTLSATDHLLHVCAHGLRWSEPPAVHWLADAFLILAAPDEPIAWERLVRQARKRRLTLQLHASLRLLRDELGADVPPTVLDELTAVAPPRWCRLEFRARTARPALHRGLFLHWCDHLRRSDPTRSWRHLRTFPRYLCAAWGVQTVWRLPGVALSKTVARLRHRPEP